MRSNTEQEAIERLADRCGQLRFQRDKLAKIVQALEDWYDQGTEQGPSASAQLFDDDHSFREHILDALATLGESLQQER